MNEVQKVFGFEIVALSAPIDAWDLENRADDGSPYLWAEKLAHRLGKIPAELQVDVLACITQHWMRDNEYLDLYGWWPENRKPAGWSFFLRQALKRCLPAGKTPTVSS